MENSQHFRWPDYLVLTIGLLLSAGIGVYYAVQRRRSSNDGTAEYLMGSRAMGVIPVASSLIVCVIPVASSLIVCVIFSLSKH